MLAEFVTLSNAIRLPKLGLGTYELTGQECHEAVVTALQAGYTHIDTAISYENHKTIGSAIAGYPRSSLFLTSKIPSYLQGYDETKKATAEALSDLKTDYLDLMLIHWPGVTRSNLPPNDPEIVNIRHNTWRALEELYSEGKFKAIGVSNFLELHLTKLLNVCRIKPMVNQFEYHPWCHHDDLVDFCKRNMIAVEAYSPLARADPTLWSSPVIGALAEKYGVSKGQILLRWSLQKGCVVVPKSSKPERVRANGQLNFVIEREERGDRDALHCDRRTCWDPNSIRV